MNRTEWNKIHPDDIWSTVEFRTFSDMKQRCNNPNNCNYKYYGGRGIKVLYKDFAEFLSDVGKKPDESVVRYTIERIDNDGQYEVGNCIWATYLEQSKNKRKRA